MVDDPVVAYIRVTDPKRYHPRPGNNQSATGATITPHYSEPDFTILKFRPTNAETIEVKLRARDADDPNLTTESSFIIHVRNEDYFQRPGSRLRELASTRDLLIGYAAIRNFYEFPDGALYADIASEEFNIVSTENSLKWDLLNPLPGKFQWAAADNLVQHAKSSRQTIHAPTLVWYTQLPQWIKRTPIGRT